MENIVGVKSIEQVLGWHWDSSKLPMAGSFSIPVLEITYYLTGQVAVRECLCFVDGIGLRGANRVFHEILTHADFKTNMAIAEVVRSDRYYESEFYDYEVYSEGEDGEPDFDVEPVLDLSNFKASSVMFDFDDRPYDELEEIFPLLVEAINANMPCPSSLVLCTRDDGLVVVLERVWEESGV